MNKLYKKDIVTAEDLTQEQINLIFSKTHEMEQLVKEKGGDERLRNRIMAALFFEPSTRTFSSFITAMQRLGGGFIPLNDMRNTSIAKGETWEDTIKVFTHYADIFVIRHPNPGSVEEASKYTNKPVINAGDGINEHPTQALIDLYTIEQTFHKINDLNILIIGDLAHYRPTNSLVKLLAKYKNVRISLASPKQLPLQDNIRKYLIQNNASFKEYNEFNDLLPEVDVLYVTRVKKEYMDVNLYQQVKGSYIVNNSVVNKMKKNSIILHCLPRIDEISKEVDINQRSLYLNKQIENGLYLRMALLDLLLLDN